MFIQPERTSLVWGATLAIGVGILLGGSAARAQNHACSQTQTLPGHCLSESPRVRVVHGMAGGAFASGGALMMIELGKVLKR